MQFNMSKIHPSWNKIVAGALKMMDQQYLKAISQQSNIIPKHDYIFNAFTLPLDQVNYILLGESPYPRADSANGYAFWDARVKTLWSKSGLTKEVNRATSLRNFIKMLLITSGKLSSSNQSQIEISNIKKDKLINVLSELFNHLLEDGFLLLNASLVLSESSIKTDAKFWRPFIEYVINQIHLYNNSVKLILFGNIAKEILSMQLPKLDKLCSEHPYNLSFITNPEILAFFKPFNLLDKKHV